MNIPQSPVARSIAGFFILNCRIFADIHAIHGDARKAGALRAAIQSMGSLVSVSS
jgi:hypothetical protein